MRFSFLEHVDDTFTRPSIHPSVRVSIFGTHLRHAGLYTLIYLLIFDYFSLIL